MDSDSNILTCVQKLQVRFLLRSTPSTPCTSRDLDIDIITTSSSSSTTTATTDEYY